MNEAGQIIERICYNHSIQIKDALSHRRHGNLVAARWEIWGELRSSLGWSYSRIARKFSRDHTTIISGIQALSDRSKSLVEKYPFKTIRNKEVVVMDSTLTPPIPGKTNAKTDPTLEAKLGALMMQEAKHVRKRNKHLKTCRPAQRKAKITSGRYAVMNEISNFGATSAGQIASNIGKRLRNVERCCKSAKRAGLLASPEGKNHIYTMTEQGKNLLKDYVKWES